MNYAFILAGGIGERMKSDIPKQFLKINGIPIIIHTIKIFLEISEIDKILVICHEDYIDYLNNLLKEYDIETKVMVTKGGTTRLNSVLNGIEYIKKNYGIADEDILLAHDSVRPFVSETIIKENLLKAKQSKAATTVVDLTETIVESDSKVLRKAYPRHNLFSGQSPQTFNISYFLENVANIPKNIQEKYTDLSECIFYNGGTVEIVYGDMKNIKITTPIDILIAEQQVKNKQ